MNDADRKLQQLRTALSTHGLHAYLVPSSDEHLNEYLPEWGKRREFLSGFSGSAGDLLVTLDAAWLATDSRYHLQAQDELAGSSITLLALGSPGVPSLSELITTLAEKTDGFRLGVDPGVLPLA